MAAAGGAAVGGRRTRGWSAAGGDRGEGGPERHAAAGGQGEDDRWVHQRLSGSPPSSSIMGAHGADMSTEPIRSILVVGGGTAGWLSAAYLQRALGATVKVSLVESKNIGRIGVGEATVSTLRFTMKFLGFAEEDWMPHVGATYKTAIRFERWNQPPSAGPEHFDHPFFERNQPAREPVPSFFPEMGTGSGSMPWHRRKLTGIRTPYAYAVFPGPRLCDERKSPRFKGSRTARYRRPTTGRAQVPIRPPHEEGDGARRRARRGRRHRRRSGREEGSSAVCRGPSTGSSAPTST